MYISSPNSPHRFLPESTSASYDENGLDFSAKKFHTVQNLLNCISFFSSFSLAPSLLSSFDFSLTLLSVCLLFKWAFCTVRSLLGKWLIELYAKIFLWCQNRKPGQLRRQCFWTVPLIDCLFKLEPPFVHSLWSLPFFLCQHITFLLYFIYVFCCFFSIFLFVLFLLSISIFMLNDAS